MQTQPDLILALQTTRAGWLLRYVTLVVPSSVAVDDCASLDVIAQGAGGLLSPSKSDMHVAPCYMNVMGNVDLHIAPATMMLLPEVLVAFLGSDCFCSSECAS